ncbi:hypothetical protein [Fibrella arboris]|uniref:hypothetical protein n=1 Tax=Fibrella arboris TaxID=3242486 RepID=UPI003521E6E3
MKPATIHDLLIEAMEEHLPEGWTIARLNVHFLTNGTDVEFSGTYLDEQGEPQPLTTDFPDEVTEATQRLYQLRNSDAQPRANVLQLDLTAAGQYTTTYSWDQEIQDEDEHFSKGGTASDWQAIREARYGTRTGD